MSSAALPSGRFRSISTVLLPDSCASDTAKLVATVVTPEPPLAPANSSSFPVAFFSALPEGRRTEARTIASAIVVAVIGCARNSRAPARMHRTSMSGFTCSEYTITVTLLLPQMLSTTSSAYSGSLSSSNTITSYSASSSLGTSSISGYFGYSLIMLPCSAASAEAIGLRRLSVGPIRATDSTLLPMASGVVNVVEFMASCFLPALLLKPVSRTLIAKRMKPALRSRWLEHTASYASSDFPTPVPDRAEDRACQNLTADYRYY